MYLCASHPSRQRHTPIHTDTQPERDIYVPELWQLNILALHCWCLNDKRMRKTKKTTTKLYTPKIHTARDINKPPSIWWNYISRVSFAEAKTGTLLFDTMKRRRRSYIILVGFCIAFRSKWLVRWTFYVLPYTHRCVGLVISSVVRDSVGCLDFFLRSSHFF